MDIDFPGELNTTKQIGNVQVPQAQQQQQEDKQHFSSFSDSLKDFIVGNFDVPDNTIEDAPKGELSDPFEVVREFRSIAAQAAVRTLDSSGSGTRDRDVEYSDWVLEANFWHLLELLLSFRISSAEKVDKSNEFVVYPYNSDALLEKKLLSMDKKLYQVYLIFTWLQGHMKIPERPSDLPTSKWSHSLVAGGVTSADLDFPLRDPKNVELIDIQDKKQDHAFYKYIYELLIVGDIQKVLDECRRSNNITLAMIFCGSQQYYNPVIDGERSDGVTVQQGTKHHSAWKRLVYNLSQQPELDVYERAIYSFLSGHAPDASVLEESDWDSELLIHLNEILQSNIDIYVEANGHEKNDDILLFPRTKPHSLEKALNIVSAHHPKESVHPIRVLTGAAMLDTLASVIHSSVDMLLDIVNGKEQSNEFSDEPYLLRILVHLIIVLDIIQPGHISKQDKVKLITAYISVLKFYGYYDSIPIYTKFLDDRDALNAYSFILSTIQDPALRDKQLELIDFLRLPRADILRRVVQRVFEETEPAYVPEKKIAITYDISDVDRHLMFSVEWLLKGQLYSDSLLSFIAMARRLLINGKIGSLEYFMGRNSMLDIIKAYKLDTVGSAATNTDELELALEIKEVVEYKLLIDLFNEYKEWRKAIRQLNSESNIPSLIEKFQTYSVNAVELVKSFLVQLINGQESNDSQILYEIRVSYVPYLIIELHKGLVEAAKLLKIPTFIEDALNYTNLVANETDKIYLLFQASGRLEEYLQLVAHTATLVNKELT